MILSDMLDLFYNLINYIKPHQFVMLFLYNLFMIKLFHFFLVKSNECTDKLVYA